MDVAIEGCCACGRNVHLNVWRKRLHPSDQFLGQVHWKWREFCFTEEEFGDTADDGTEADPIDEKFSSGISWFRKVFDGGFMDVAVFWVNYTGSPLTEAAKTFSGLLAHQYTLVESEISTHKQSPPNSPPQTWRFPWP